MCFLAKNVSKSVKYEKKSILKYAPSKIKKQEKFVYQCNWEYFRILNLTLQKDLVDKQIS